MKNVYLHNKHRKALHELRVMATHMSVSDLIDALMAVFYALAGKTIDREEDVDLARDILRGQLQLMLDDYFATLNLNYKKNLKDEAYINSQADNLQNYIDSSNLRGK